MGPRERRGKGLLLEAHAEAPARPARRDQRQRRVAPSPLRLPRSAFTLTAEHGILAHERAPIEDTLAEGFGVQLQLIFRHFCVLSTSSDISVMSPQAVRDFTEASGLALLPLPKYTEESAAEADNLAFID